MPSIIPSPGSPGSPNVFATIPLNQNISLGAGQRLYTTSPMFVLFDHTVTLGTEYFTLNNSGTMWIDSTGIARLLFPWNFGSVTNSGLMVARSNGGDASYVFNVGSTWQGGLDNSGRMFAISTAGDAATIVDYSSSAIITNSGIIAAQGALDVGAITRMNGGQIINTATGQILAEGGDAYAVMLIYGLQFITISTMPAASRPRPPIRPTHPLGSTSPISTTRPFATQARSRPTSRSMISMRATVGIK
jgi:hypothetical protein